jgi:crotonobetaine/carnitine-CoA ligase
VAAASTLPATFAPAQRTLPVILQRQAALFGARSLFKTGATVWTVADACDIAARAAGMLAAAGIRQGDRVALMCGNRAEFMQIYLGCAWLGAIAVPINTASRGPQLRHILANSGARLLVIEAALGAALATLDRKGLALERLWVIDEASPLPIELPQTALPGLGEPAPPGAVRPGDTVAILYTSGTTGPAKGVCCPQAQYFWWGANTGMLLGLQAGDVMVTTLPLFHTNALNAFYQALLHGAQLVVEPRFSASAFWQSLVTHQANVTFVLGAMVPILLSKPPSALDRAHPTRVALAPGVPAHLQAPFTERFGIALVDGFGSTETNFVIGDTSDRQKPGWMGPVYHGFQARVVDDDDTELPRGQAGELLLRADEPFAFATGYFGMPEKTVEAWRNLWFHTGDRAIHEEDGTFKFVDRLKDAIRRRGENISSFEVEQVLLSHPAIATAAAFPVRSELAEDEVMVALVLREGHELTPESLMEFCQPRMAYFAIPRYVAFVAELPATENGKIQKYKLREAGIIPGTWDREAAGYKLVR